jgi:opacity protein-like surface antigen
LVGPFVLDLGARVSFSPIKYDTMDATKQASLVGIRATVGVTYRVNDKLGVRGDAGIGVAMLRGLVDGNPFTDTRKAGTFTMPSFRVGVAAEYAITPNLVATVAPLSIGFSPAPNELFISSLAQFDVLVGLGYRM